MVSTKNDWKRTSHSPMCKAFAYAAFVVVCAAIVLRPVRFASAQAPADAGESLAAKVVDPSAALSTITIQDKVVFTRWGIDDGENEVDLQPVIAWMSFGHLNIFRVRIPFITYNPPGATGLDAVQAFNLTIFPRGNVKYLLGVLFQFAPGRGQQAGNFGIGPMLGAVKSKKAWTYGFLNQNIFGSHIASSQLQPILAKTLSPKVSMASMSGSGVRVRGGSSMGRHRAR